MTTHHQMPVMRSYRRLPEIMIVSVSGGIGGVVRFGLGRFFPPMTGHLISTSLLLNSVGCFLLGIVEITIKLRVNDTSLDRAGGVPRSVMFVTGFCGGFATIAGLTPESMALFEAGAEERAALYGLGSILLANVSLAIGGRLGRFIAQRSSM